MCQGREQRDVTPLPKVSNDHRLNAYTLSTVIPVNNHIGTTLHYLKWQSIAGRIGYIMLLSLGGAQANNSVLLIHQDSVAQRNAKTPRLLQV